MILLGIFAANKSIRSIYLQLCAFTDEHVAINAKIKLKSKEINKKSETNEWMEEKRI